MDKNEKQRGTRIRHRDMGRAADALRPVRIRRNYLMHPQGSVLIEMGATKVICTAMVSNSTPAFLWKKNQGWVTAEYAMLPGSTGTRKKRDRNRVDGRSVEIQRLIGRALRSVVDLKALGERTITIDCDVIQADGGTRTAAITGAYVALCDAVDSLIQEGLLSENPIRDQVAAVSVGVVDGRVLLDLCYEEDSGADVDMNLVMTRAGHIVEIQGTGESRPFTSEEMREMMAYAERGIRRLMDIQNQCREALAARLTLTLATSNLHKKQELESMLAPLGISVQTLSEVGLGDLDIVEDGDTFEANARIKAQAVYERVGGLVLADDSGLEVDALDGAPGIYSARYSGEPRSDARNNAQLLRALELVPDAERTARFVSVLALTYPDGTMQTFRGTVEGLIGFAPRGDAGFGYDPLFIVPELDRTFSELTDREKNAISHRGRAMVQVQKALKWYCEGL